jgi:nucleotide-binding universal stress UspA family protein
MLACWSWGATATGERGKFYLVVAPRPRSKLASCRFLCCIERVKRIVQQIRAAGAQSGVPDMYKTILMHCNDKRRIRDLLLPAVELSERYQAHLTALSVVPPIAIFTSVDGSVTTTDAHCQLYREANPAMREAFEESVRGRGFAAEWRDDDARALPVIECVLPYARTADLIIASQTDPTWFGSGQLDIADQLVLESGRPVLIIPNAAARGSLGERVLVAWNGRREAARAAFDALPVLRQAKEVKVVWVNPQWEGEPLGDIPTADICLALARHGVRCEGTEQIKPHVNVGETLLACAKDTAANLLVMGCYGHARLREFVFGGASRHVLQHMPIPILMSH